MSWNSDTGIWKFWIFRGTTPRNADVWTLDVVIGKYELWMGTGKHGYVTFFSGPEEKWSFERDPEICDCYGCVVAGRTFTWTPEEIKAMNAILTRDDRPVRKLPTRSTFSEDMHQPLDPDIREKLFNKYRPVGCHPSDCCGDLSAHGKAHDCGKGCR
jgi:hypothetical protein